MVKDRKSPSTIISAPIQNTKNYLSVVLKNSLLFYPFDYTTISPSYMGPAIYIVVLGFINVLLYTLFLLKDGTDSKLFGINFVYYFLFPVLSWTVCCWMAIMLVTYLEAMIFEKDYDSRQFGLHVSCLTYLSVVYVMKLSGIGILYTISNIGYTLLSTHYLLESCRYSVEYPSNRKATFHNILAFIYFLAIQVALLSVISYSIDLLDSAFN